MMLYLGIDLGTRAVHIAGVSPDDEWCFATVPLPADVIPGRGMRRAIRAELGVEFWDRVSVAWIEEPYYNRLNPRTYAALSAVKGAVADAIPQHVTVDVIAPAVWRTELGMPGNAKRDEAKAAARQWCAEYGLPVHDLSDDLCDAACIARVAIVQSERYAS